MSGVTSPRPVAGSARPAVPVSTQPRLRAGLDGIPTYQPGGPASDDQGRPSYKVSSNENPYPPLPCVQAVIADLAGSVNRYPDLAAADLVAAIAAHVDVPAAHVATGTGSVEVLRQIVQATAGPGDEVLYAWRSFEAYPTIVQIAGAQSVTVPLTPSEHHDLDAMANAVTDRTRLILICTPNNPTGTITPNCDLTRFLDRVPADVLVVIDEAYHEFVRDFDAPDALALYRDRPNIAVLRTFSKAYGLAGLRVGYATAHPPVTDALHKTAVPFGVNTLAQAAAIASLHARDQLLERVQALVNERIRVHAALRDQGWSLPDSQANFVWLRLGASTSDFAEAAARDGLTVRPYGHDGVRVTIDQPPANDRLLEIANRWLRDNPQRSA